MSEQSPPSHAWKRIRPPTSLEAYRFTMARRYKYTAIQLRREAGEYIPMERHEACALRTKMYDLAIIEEPMPEHRSNTSAPILPLQICDVSGHQFENPTNGKLTMVDIEMCSQQVPDKCSDKCADDKCAEWLEWLGVLHVFCTHKGERIGEALALFVDRELIRSRFMEQMFSATGVLRDIATWIFDRYGRLRAEHKQSTRNPEVYDWRYELDNGAFLVIDSFSVVEKWRRKELARTMIHTLVQKVRGIETPAVSVLAVPGWLAPKPIDQQLAQMSISGDSPNQTFSDAAKSLLGSMGFCRIGSTPCFGVRIDSESRQYSVKTTMEKNEITSAIYQHEGKWAHGQASRIGIPFGEWADQVKWFERERKEGEEQVLILRATATLPDGELVDWYDANGEEYNVVDWLQKDNFQRNVLHLAAIGLKSWSMGWLLSNLGVGICNELKTSMDMRGYTPLQELCWRLEQIRITDGESALSDKFGGFCEGGETCLAMLKCLELPQPGDVLPQPAMAFFPDICGDWPGILEDLAAKFGINMPWNDKEDGDDQGITYNTLGTVEYTVPSSSAGVAHQNSSPDASQITSSSNDTKTILELRIKRVPSPDVHTNGPGRIITGARLKFGCDCNMCLGGVISHRMKFVLFIQAAYLKDRLEMRGPNREYNAFWEMMVNFWTEKAGLAAAMNYRLSTRRHSRDAKIFRAISRVIGTWEKFPTINLVKIWLTYDDSNENWVYNPMRCDPAVKTALRVLFEFVKDQDEYAGTRRFGQNMDDYRDTMNLLGLCRNDKEYGCAARKCVGAAMDWPFNDVCFVRRGPTREKDSGAAAFGKLYSCRGGECVSA